MSWIISKAMMNLYENSRCSQEPVAESLEENSLDGKPSVPSKTNPTQQVYLSQDKMKAFSRLSRFGMMSEPLMEDRGKDLLTWYQEDFLARTSPVQEKEKDWKEQEVDSGLNFSESSMKYNLDLFSSKIPPFCVQEDLMSFSKDLPKSGTMLRGECYQHQTVVPIINEKECGFWPTPQAGDSRATINKKTQQQKMLAHAVQKEVGDGGKLNPTWVEWLMAFPLGWTDLKPLETDKYQSWLQSLSNN